MNMLLLSVVSLLTMANTVLAQVDEAGIIATPTATVPASATEEATGVAELSVSPVAAEDFVPYFSAEGEDFFADIDLEVDLAAENLPTTDAWSFRWERMRDRIGEMFTFNMEKKSQLMQERLHRLDRKMAACAEIGDEKCLEKVEELRQKVTARTAAYIQKKEALRERLLEKFQAWREKREAKEEAWRERVQQKKDNRLELVTERQANRKAARERRKEYVKERQTYIKQRREQIKQNIDEKQGLRQENMEKRQEQRKLNLEQRQQNSEQLIEMRSDTLKSKLDATRLKVDKREQLTEESGE